MIVHKSDSDEYHLRSLRQADYSTVWSIFTSLFDKNEIPEFKSAWAEHDPEKSIGIYTTDSTQIHGFTLVKGNKLCYIGVGEDSQKCGFGTILLRYILTISHQNRQTLYLNPVHSPSVINWYAKHGFTISRESYKMSSSADNPYIVMNNHPYETRSKNATSPLIVLGDTTEHKRTRG